MIRNKEAFTNDEHYSAYHWLDLKLHNRLFEVAIEQNENFTRQDFIAALTEFKDYINKSYKGSCPGAFCKPLNTMSYQELMHFLEWLGRHTPSYSRDLLAFNAVKEINDLAVKMTTEL